MTFRVGSLMPQEFITTSGIGIADGAGSKHSTLPVSTALIPHGLDDHIDVDLTGLAVNDCLCFDGSGWIASSPANILSNASIDDLADVNIVLPDVDDILAWDGTEWVVRDPADAASTFTLGDIGDVLLTGLAAGELVRFDGVNWVNVDADTVFQDATVNLNDLDDVSAGSPTTDDLLGWNGSSWVPVDPDTVVGNASIDLNDLSNVNLAGAANGDYLCFNGSTWVAAPVSAGMAEDLMFLRGTVAFNGTIIDGTGFSVVKSGIGIYQVTFTSPYSNTPTVVATGQQSQSAPTFTLTGIIVYNITPSGFSAKTVNWRGAPTEWADADETFGFIVSGD